MNKMLLLLAVLLLTACGAAPDQVPSSDSSKQTRGETASGQPSGVDVKVTRNNKTLTAFRSAGDNTGINALLAGDELSIEITSPDQKWSLTITVPRAKEGAYRLAPIRENGKAMIGLAGGDDMMMVVANAGELKLDELSESYCSGSFTGTGRDSTGNKYTYEGKFSKVRARRQE